jgi:hypothetical protein
MPELFYRGSSGHAPIKIRRRYHGRQDSQKGRQEKTKDRQGEKAKKEICMKVKNLLPKQQKVFIVILHILSLSVQRYPDLVDL